MSKGIFSATNDTNSPSRDINHMISKMIQVWEYKLYDEFNYTNSPKENINHIKAQKTQ